LDNHDEDTPPIIYFSSYNEAVFKTNKNNVTDTRFSNDNIYSFIPETQFDEIDKDINDTTLKPPDEVKNTDIIVEDTPPSEQMLYDMQTIKKKASRRTLWRKK